MAENVESAGQIGDPVRPEINRKRNDGGLMNRIKAICLNDCRSDRQRLKIKKVYQQYDGTAVTKRSKLKPKLV